MAIRGVLKSGEPLLREKAREVTVFDERLHLLLDDMKETMDFEDGVGLAAPQIGLLKRICVISPNREDYYELINPTIEKSEGTQVCVEGCLSIPGFRGHVIRPKKITVRAFDRHGKLLFYEVEDFLADIFCHEIDHLDGILFTDLLVNGTSGGLSNNGKLSDKPSKSAKSLKSLQALKAAKKGKEKEAKLAKEAENKRELKSKRTEKAGKEKVLKSGGEV